MRDGSLARSQLSRLLRILLEIQREAFPNAADLSRLCGVSRRTLHRDLDALRAAGVPLIYRKDRLGYDLDRRFHSPPPAVERAELLAILWLTLAARGSAGSEMDAQAWTGLVKLVEAASPEAREPARVLLGLASAPESSNPNAAPTSAMPLPLIEALARRGPIRLRLRDAQGMESSTRFDPYRLEIRAGIWTLVGRSSVDRKTIQISVDSIYDVEWLDALAGPRSPRPHRAPRRLTPPRVSAEG